MTEDVWQAEATYFARNMFRGVPARHPFIRVLPGMALIKGLSIESTHLLLNPPHPPNGLVTVPQPGGAHTTVSALEIPGSWDAMLIISGWGIPPARLNYPDPHRALSTDHMLVLNLIGTWRSRVFGMYKLTSIDQVPSVYHWTDRLPPRWNIPLYQFLWLATVPSVASAWRDSTQARWMMELLKWLGDFDTRRRAQFEFIRNLTIKAVAAPQEGVLGSSRERVKIIREHVPTSPTFEEIIRRRGSSARTAPQ